MSQEWCSRGRLTGFRPSYWVTTRTRIDGLFEDIKYWLVPEDKENLPRIHQLARKHSAVYRGGDKKSGLTFGFESDDNRKSFAAAVRVHVKRAGNI